MDGFPHHPADPSSLHGDDDGFLALDAARGIFRLDLPGGGAARFDPVDINRRLDAAEADAGRFNDLSAALARQARAVADGAPADDPGLLAEAAQVRDRLARLGFAAFDRKPLREDQRDGWTEPEAIAAIFGFVRWESERSAAPAR